MYSSADFNYRLIEPFNLKSKTPTVFREVWDAVCSLQLGSDVGNPADAITDLECGRLNLSKLY